MLPSPPSRAGQLQSATARVPVEKDHVVDGAPQPKAVDADEHQDALREYTLPPRRWSQT